jgi:hypothetical protein
MYVYMYVYIYSFIYIYNDMSFEVLVAVTIKIVYCRLGCDAMYSDRNYVSDEPVARMFRTS